MYSMPIKYATKCQKHFFAGFLQVNRFMSNQKSSEKFTHFGYQDVKESEKKERVGQVFSNVAQTYDTMNDAMSFGIHRLWKNDFVNMICPNPKTALLDVAGGTGDITFRYIERLKNNGHTNIEPVNVCDINKEMLEVGKTRAGGLGMENDIIWTCGNAEELPFKSNTFDLYTIAFGIRNCTHINKVLSEAHRVLKPGGRFFCLEFSEVSSPILQKLYDGYSFQVIPAMGEVIAGDWASYQYLVESIRKFPKPLEFEDMIKDGGFKYVKHTQWTFGVVAVHSGFKI